MNELLQVSIAGLAIMLAMGFMTWLYSLYRSDVSIVDSLWSLMFLAAGVCYLLLAGEPTQRNLVLLIMLLLWSIRLSAFLTLRNWGQQEDRRYREIRANNQPNFHIKSLYIVFGLQAVLAWVISIPLLTAFSSATAFGWIEAIALLLWTTGFAFEAIADLQLYRFKSNPCNKGRVLDSGLWAYSRHPNYFGEALVWWGFFLFAFSSGYWWTIYSPVLMTLLLLKVSGVSLMEKDMTERRPAYADYIARTNAFIPGRPGAKNIVIEGGQQS